MKNLLFFGLVLLSAHTAKAHDLSDDAVCEKAYWKDMPTSLNLLELEKWQLLEFPSSETDPPIFRGMPVSQSRKKKFVEPHELTSDRHFLYLPKSEKSELLGSDPEHFQLPIGTILFHKISWKDDRESLYELRLLKKVGKGWSLGSYLPSQSNPNQLVLNQNCKKGNPETFQFNSAGKNERIDFHRITPNLCLHCHSLVHDPSVKNELMVPCGFTKSDALTLDWFKKTFSYKNTESKRLPAAKSSPASKILGK